MLRRKSCVPVLPAHTDETVALFITVGSSQINMTGEIFEIPLGYAAKQRNRAVLCHLNLIGHISR